MRLLCLSAIAALLFTSSAEAVPRSLTNDSGDRAGTLAASSARGSGQALQWIPVHGVGQSPCAIGDEGTAQDPSLDEVWCFEGAAGDSTWPVQPSSAGFQHWSRFDPPGGAPSKWHITSTLGGPSTGGYNAWCGCDSVGTSSACSETAFWIFQQGYGDDWDYALTLDLSGGDATTGGTIEFDLRYDTECNYDYAYLEYLTPSGTWATVVDTSGTPAVFNAVSGNPDNQSGGSGEPCGDDIYGASGERDLGIGNEPFYGNSIWLTDVTFPLPAQTGGIQLRWRGTSDGAWSDADGRGDTDGLVAIDNVEITLAATGTVVTDDFETGDFAGLQVSGPSLSSPPTWTPGGLEGNTYDGWHLEFSPNYKNKGNGCSFSDDWMWAAKPAGMPIPENGFDYILVSPAVDVAGWTGGVIRYEEYFCMPDGRDDLTYNRVRTFDSSAGWSPWLDPGGFVIWDPGCYEFRDNQYDFSEFLESGPDSLQYAWGLLDFSEPGGLSWGKHAGVQYLIDNVAVASYDASGPDFPFSFDLFRDTFSRSDPAHTDEMLNAHEGQWPGRAFAARESLSVDLSDPDGITAGNVRLHWRVGEGSPLVFGPWLDKAMNLSDTGPFGAMTFRSTIGNDGSEDWSGSPGDGLIWGAGTTVEYYVTAQDDLGNTSRRPDTGTFDFSVLPFGNTSPGQGGAKILVVHEFGDQMLDFENSFGFDPNGGPDATGWFQDPVYTSEPEFVEDVLVALGLEFDRYDAHAIIDPPGSPNPGAGIGGFLDDLGQPAYDLILWSLGKLSLNEEFEDETIPDLETYLDAGGHLLLLHDFGAFRAAGGGSPDLIDFFGEYLGTDVPPFGELIAANVLQLGGEIGTTYEGQLRTLFGGCFANRTYSPLELSSPVGGQAEVLFRFEGGEPADNGRAAVIRAERTGGGVAITAPGLGAHVSRYGAACFLGQLLSDELGVLVPNLGDCTATDVTLPPPALHALALSPPRPSPFLDTTALHFSLPTAGVARVALFDVTGRQVRQLADRRFGAGEHSLKWDGRDSGGVPVAAGVYFVQLQTGSSRLTQKVVRLP